MKKIYLLGSAISLPVLLAYVASAQQLLPPEIQQIFDKLLNNSDLWNYSNYHLPFGDFSRYMSFAEFLENAKIASARCARISYERPKIGRNDEELADDLLKAGHLSPFEHCAYWEKWAKISSLNSKSDDRLGEYGWSSLRSYYEFMESK